MITKNGNPLRVSAPSPASRDTNGAQAGTSTSGEDLESATPWQVLADARTFSEGYAALLQTWDAIQEDDDAQIRFNKKLRALRSLTSAALALRRAEFQAARLQLARERLEFLQEKQRNKSASSRASRTSSSTESAAAPRSPTPSGLVPTKPRSQAPVSETATKSQQSGSGNPAAPGVLQSIQRSLSMPQLTIDHLFPELTEKAIIPLSGPIQVS